MRIAALVKQVPKFEAMELGPDRRLVRERLESEMNPYCRRAVAKGVELARASGGSCTVITLGPPAAADVLREAVAWGADEGVLITDPAFAGSDTIATAKALASAVRRLGPFDLVFTGRNSVDADTGQVGPGLAELLDLPFITGARELELTSQELKVRCEEDDGFSDRVVGLPAVVSTAERLCEPCKMPPDQRAAVDPDRISTLSAADLGPGPWGQEGSGTYVGEARVLETSRQRRVLAGAPGEQVAEAVRLLVEWGALDETQAQAVAEPIPAGRACGPAVAVLVEPDRAAVARELLSSAAGLAAEMNGHVVALTTSGTGTPPSTALSSWGADRALVLEGAVVEEDVAGGVAAWVSGQRPTPWAILAPSTTWGREVAGRLSTRLGAGLTGDAVELEVLTSVSKAEHRLVAWKPAFGGRLVAAIHATTPLQLVTVRPGTVRPGSPRPPDELPTETVTVECRGRVIVLSSERDDDIADLALARRVVGIGAAIPPERYRELDRLLRVLNAELGATRKVTDRGWLPRARQIGITGRSIAPQLYVALGLSGQFNHAVGIGSAGTVLAVNPDPEAFIWEHCDVGIVGDWAEVVPLLTERLRSLQRDALTRQHSARASVCLLNG